MKKIFVFAVALSFVCRCFAEEAVITGRSDVLPDSSEVILFQQFGQAGTGVAQDTVVNGCFRLVVPVDSGLTKTEISIFESGFPSMGREIYLRPGAVVEVDARGYNIHTWTVKSNVPEQTESDRFLMHSKELWDAYQKQWIDYNLAISSATDKATRDSINTAFKATEYQRDSIQMAIGHRDIALLRSLPVNDMWLEKAEDLARSLEFYSKYQESYNSEFKSLFEGLDESIKTSSTGKKIRTLLYPPKIVEIGDTVPDGTFYDIEGNEHHLADYRGKWLLLDFWSRGCYACVMAIPELHEFAKKNADVIEVISLSIDVDKMWREATDSYNLEGNNWNEGKEDLGLYRNFGAKGMPTFVLVSPEGIVKNQSLGYSQGMFDRFLRFYTVPKEPMSISTAENMITVTNPEYKENTTDCILDIERIELSDKNTTLFFKVYYRPGWWIKIDPSSFLTTTDGKSYKLIGSEGITPGEEFTADENGSGSFSLKFEPIPTENVSVDFQEGPASNWHISGIRLK